MSRYLLAALLALTVVVPSSAGIRRNAVRVNVLRINGHRTGAGWQINSPTLLSNAGYLAHDDTGESTAVSFSRKKGPHTHWAFVDVQHFTREFPDRRLRDGWDREQTGYRMKLRAAEGPHKGWYLGRVDGELVLVEDARQAATLEMIERESEILHK